MDEIDSIWKKIKTSVNIAFQIIYDLVWNRVGFLAITILQETDNWSSVIALSLQIKRVTCGKISSVGMI